MNNSFTEITDQPNHRT